MPSAIAKKVSVDCLSFVTLKIERIIYEKFKKHAVLFAISLFVFGACQENAEVNEEVKPDTAAHLKSWNEGETKNAIITFVKDVTDENSENFIPVKDRVATFDNDGNLWSEQPAYFQLFFAMDRIKALAPQHP